MPSIPRNDNVPLPEARTHTCALTICRVGSHTQKKNTNCKIIASKDYYLGIGSSFFGSRLLCGSLGLCLCFGFCLCRSLGLGSRLSNTPASKLKSSISNVLLCIPMLTYEAYVSIRQHTSSFRQHTSRSRQRATLQTADSVIKCL
jgi:hypothetical protein